MFVKIRFHSVRNRFQELNCTVNIFWNRFGTESNRPERFGTDSNGTVPIADMTFLNLKSFKEWLNRSNIHLTVQKTVETYLVICSFNLFIQIFITKFHFSTNSRFSKHPNGHVQNESMNFSPISQTNIINHCESFSLIFSPFFFFFFLSIRCSLKAS